MNNSFEKILLAVFVACMVGMVMGSFAATIGAPDWAIVLTGIGLGGLALATAMWIEP